MNESNLSEAEIDEIVIAQANNDAAWEKSITVKSDIPTTMSLSYELASRAAFFANLHDMSFENWLIQIIQERVHFEESAFSGLKQVMEKKSIYKT